LEIAVALVVGTDTYASLDDLVEILTDYGHGAYLDAHDTLSQEGHARSARLFLDLSYSWIGQRAVPGQSLAWPRSGAIDQGGLPIPSDLVPEAIVTAQALLMVAAGSGDLAGSTGGTDRAVIRESADDASIEYAPGSAARRYPQVSAMIRHLTTAHRLGPFRQITAARG
jgi:hypothetical protein